MTRAIIHKKVSPTDTILNLPVGIPTSIKNRDIKTGVVKTTISRLRNEGHIIEYTEKGRIDDILVTLVAKLK